MLRFFKSSLPAQVLALLLLVLGLRLPLLLPGLPPTTTEVLALLTGERLHDGALLYRDLYVGTGPLAAIFFAALDVVVSRPVWLYRVAALLLLLAQALRFNQVLNRADVLPERGYVAALIYLIVGSLSTDLDALSPLLLGHTFVVFALSALLPTSREGYDNRRLFRAGFLLGLGALCYLPLALFTVLGSFAVVIFAANAFRSFLLLLCGLVFPTALAATLFFYFGALPGFQQFYLDPGWQILTSGAAAVGQLPASLQLRLLAGPLLLLLLGVLRGVGTTLGPVFQAKFRQVMLVWTLVVLGIMALSRGTAAGMLVLLLPPLAYFSLFLSQKMRPAWVPELLFLVVLAGTVVVRYRAYVPGLADRLRLPLESSFGLLPDPRFARLQGHTLLVLGPGLRPYLSARSATPYLDWPLAQADLGHLNEYVAVVRTARRSTPPPDFILDQIKLLPRLSQQLPGVFGNYRKVEGVAGLYQQK